MGYTTLVHIYNDGMHYIEENPDEFAQAVIDKHTRGGTAGVGSHVNLVHVIPSAHADTFQLVCSWRNMPLSLTQRDQRTKEIASRDPELVQVYIDRARDELNMLEAMLEDQAAKES